MEPEKGHGKGDTDTELGGSEWDRHCDPQEPRSVPTAHSPNTRTSTHLYAHMYFLCLQKQVQLPSQFCILLSSERGTSLQGSHCFSSPSPSPALVTFQMLFNK